MDVRGPLKLNQNAILSALLDPRTADPAGSWVAGQVWFRSDLNMVRIAVGAAQYYQLRRDTDLIVNADISATAAIALSKLAVDPLARANHTGTQLAATISDFLTVRDQQRLDQHAAPTASVNLNSQKIVSLLDPTAAQDAATKNYVDLAIQGLDAKASVKAATISTNSINLAAPGSTIDGVGLAPGDRFLIKDQSTASQNGIYVFSAANTPATRALDFDSWAEMPGAYVFVEQGTVNADTGWVCTADQGGTLGTTAITFTQFSGIGSLVAGAGVSKTGNQLDVGAANGIIVNADSIQVDAAVVGRKYQPASWTGNTGGTQTLTVTHNLNNAYPVVNVYDLVGTAQGQAKVEADVFSTGVNTLTVSVVTPPAINWAFAVTVIG